MPENGLKASNVLAMLRGSGGEGMPKAVKADMRQAEALHQLRVSVGQAGGRDLADISVREAAFLAEPGQQRGGYWNRPNGGFRFRGTVHERARGEAHSLIAYVYLLIAPIYIPPP